MSVPLVAVIAGASSGIGEAWRAPFAEGGPANVRRTMTLNFDRAPVGSP
jgi:NADP-dependent 3-hydroxy acid dehydrogenase YdfG